MELSIRSIPDSRKFVATAAAHHGENYGSLVLIDQRLDDDRACAQIRRITPEVHFPESENSPGVPGETHKSANRSGQVYGQPWPLSEDFYLCVYDPQQEHYGLYLLDSFGNKIHLYSDAEVPCLDPIPVRPRLRPPVIPIQTTQARADRQPGQLQQAIGTIGVVDIYNADFAWPKNTQISALRVVQLFPKTTRKAAQPKMGIGNQSLGRGVLGAVPVEPDGSAYFEAPANVPLYFQALDQQGRAVQSMRSLTYVHSGELLICHGCHERKRGPFGSPPLTSVPLAFQKPPAQLKGDVDGSWPTTFPRLVQPVLDAHCAQCHQRERSAPGLASDIGEHGWTEAYHTLGPLAWAKHGGNGSLKQNKSSYSKAGTVGARASRLLPLLENGHYDASLSTEELYRITLWLDMNSNFFGVYHDLQNQSEGMIALPILE